MPTRERDTEGIADRTLTPRLSRTPKGEREARRLLDVATDVLSRDGMDGATLGRIASEAGVDKRMVLYYFDSRDLLLAEVVRHVGHGLAANTEALAGRLDTPAAVADAAITSLWAGTIAEPALPRAYLALASSANSEQVRSALDELKREFVELFGRLIDSLEGHGYRLQSDRPGYLALMLSIWRGLTLEYSETGDTPALQSAIAQFKDVAAAPFYGTSA